MAQALEKDFVRQGKPITRGAFIIVEGLDRAGKTTQAKKLCNELEATGRKIQTMRFPDRTSPTGKMIDSYLQSKTELDDHAVHLLFSANRWEKANSIADTVASGSTIICDRYYYSGMVYSAAKRNPSLSLEWAREPDVGLPRPDVVIFLDLDPEEAEKRGGYGNEKYEKKIMQERVREIFLGLQSIGEDEAKDMKVIDAGHPVEKVAEVILSHAMRVLNQVESGERGAQLATVGRWPQGATSRVLDHSAQLSVEKES